MAFIGPYQIYTIDGIAEVARVEDWDKKAVSVNTGLAMAESSAVAAAKNYADAEFGVDRGRLGAIEAKNVTQDADIITAREDAKAHADALVNADRGRLEIIESKNTEQDGRLDALPATYIPLSRGVLPDGTDLNTLTGPAHVGTYSLPIESTYPNAAFPLSTSVLEVQVGTGNPGSVVHRVTAGTDLAWREADSGGGWSAWAHAETKAAADTKNAEQDGRLGTIETVTVPQALTDAKGYADAKDTSNRSDWAAADTAKLVEANGYTDATDAANRAAWAAADTVTLAEAEAYTDAQDEAYRATDRALWRVEDDEHQAAAEANAKAYADAQLATKENTIVAGTTLQYRRGDKTWQTLNSAAIPDLRVTHLTTAKLLADLPSTYPLGVSYFGTSEAGWPAQYGTVHTVRWGVGRTTQTYSPSATGKTFTRTETSGLVWGAWNESALVADLKITAIAKVLADPPSAYPLGVSYFGTSEAGWPVQFGTVRTVRWAAGRTVQTYTSTSAKTFTRIETGGDTWSAFSELSVVGHVHANATTTVSGFMSGADKVKLDAADAAKALKCVRLESGKWVWDRTTGTHYLIPDHTGALIARPTPFPAPDATPSLTW